MCDTLPAVDGEPVLLGRPVQRPEQGAALHDRPAPSRVDPDRAQGCQVDHQPAVGDRVAGRAVAAAPDADLEVVLAGRPDRGDHVPNARAPDDHPRTPVDDGVPDRPGLVVPGSPGSSTDPSSEPESFVAWHRPSTPDHDLRREVIGPMEPR